MKNMSAAFNLNPSNSVTLASFSCAIKISKTEHKLLTDVDMKNNYIKWY